MKKLLRGGTVINASGRQAADTVGLRTCGYRRNKLFSSPLVHGNSSSLKNKQ